MKKILLISVLIITLLSSCKEDFDPVFYGTLSPTTFPTTETEYELYVMELYKPFLSRWGYSALAWENNFYSPEYGHIVQNDLASDITAEYLNWGGFWEGYSTGNFNFMKNQGRASHFEKVRFITRATKIIDDLEKSDINEHVKKQLVAEARMARGTMMYYLLWMYGPVPVILDAELIGTEAEANMVRPSRDTYVGAINEDLRFAADNLSVIASDYGRFNKGAALTFLMRLLMNEKQFGEAIGVGNEIKELGYELVSDYASLFREATEKNSETIWAVSCTNGPEGNFNAWAFYTYPNDFKENKVKGGWGGWNQGVVAVNWTFYDTFDENDARRNLLVAEYTNEWDGIRNRNNDLTGAVIQKYKDEGGSDNSYQGNDIVVCRYADVLLMLAEAMNEVNGPSSEAIAYVNEVRDRAQLEDLSNADTSSKDALRNAIFMERGHELYFEGLRRIDMIRMGKWQSGMAAVGKTAGPGLFPLPDYAINNSDGQLEQTPGY